MNSTILSAIKASGSILDALIYTGPISAAASPFAAYALALPFKTATTDGYWVAGTKYATLPLVPGYTYTRSGAKGERNALTTGDVIDDFAANVPGVVPSLGYWSREPLTNIALQSQDFTAAAWSVPTFITKTADAGIAPDGTTTADRMVTTGNTSVGANFTQNVAGVVSASPYTHSIWVKSASGVAFNLRLRGEWTTSVDQTVAVTSEWKRVVVLRTSEATNEVFRFGSIAAGDDFNYDIFVWQGQLVNSSRPDGGPIIATGAATVAVGADPLTHTQPKPAAAFTIFGKAELTLTKAATSYLFNWSDGTAANVIAAHLSASNLVTFTLANASVATAITGEGGTPTGARTVTFALRFNGSTWRGFVNGVALGVESAAAAIPAGTQFNTGHALGASQLNDAINGPFIVEGNKTDAEVISLMAGVA